MTRAAADQQQHGDRQLDPERRDHAQRVHHGRPSGQPEGSRGAAIERRAAAPGRVEPARVELVEERPAVQRDHADPDRRGQIVEEPLAVDGLDAAGCAARDERQQDRQIDERRQQRMVRDPRHQPDRENQLREGRRAERHQRPRPCQQPERATREHQMRSGLPPVVPLCLLGDRPDGPEPREDREPVELREPPFSCRAAL